MKLGFKTCRGPTSKNFRKIFSKDSLIATREILTKLDYTRGAGGPKGLVSNHLKSVWIRGNEEDGGNILKRMDDARFSLFDSDYEIKPSKVVIFC